MFLPRLGLKSKLLHWPFATIAIVVVSLGYSAFRRPDPAAQTKDIQAIAAKAQVWARRRAVVQQLCFNSLLGKHAQTQCQYLKENLRDESFADLPGFFKKYKTQFPDDKGGDFRAFHDWVAGVESYKTLDAESRHHPVAAAYAGALVNYRLQLAEYAKSHQSLMRGNIRIVPALDSVFLSESLTRLICQLAVLLLFAVFVEQRVGPTAVILMYLLGGVGANLFQSASLGFGVSLLGQTGAVSTMLGAFLIYFYEETGEFVLSFRGRRKAFSFPMWTYIAMAAVVLGLVSWLTDSAETYAALTVGFGLGAIMASMEKDLFPLKKTFLFPQEQKMYYEAKKTARYEEKLDIYRRIYQLNQESFYAFRALFVYFEKHRLSVSSFKTKDRQFVRQVLTQCFMYTKKNEKYDFSHQLLGKVPLWWNLTSLELPVGADQIMDRARRFHKQGNLIQCLRCYDLFLEKYAAHARAGEAHSVIMQVFDELEKFDLEPRVEILQTLLLYVKAHPTTHFNLQIRQLTQQIEKERQRAA
jgi:membrane associated rhomboid family serine protease